MSIILYTTEYMQIREKQKGLIAKAFTPTLWKKETSYSTNDIVKPTKDNGHYYRCISAGKSGEEEPKWTTGFWDEIEDGTVKWREEEPVYILDSEPADFSYPCVIVGNITPMAEIQKATGNQPATDLITYVLIKSYQLDNKTYNQIRFQAYDVLKQVQNVIRENTTLGGFSGVLRATGGLYTLPDTLPVFFEIQQSWVVRLLVKKEG